MPTHLLDPNICYLNHGAFGGTPKELLDEQNRLRLLMESEPVDFLIRQNEARWFESIAAVAEFLGSDVDGTVFVHNATAGVNAVLQSFPWKEGDEILTTNHRYDAVRSALDYSASRWGVRVVEAQVAYPLQSGADFVEAIEAAITPATRMLVVDHITSPTALITPIEQLIRLAHERGIVTLIDAAHAPGHVDVDIGSLRPDFWVGNLHKWLCAPKGAAVLYVSEPYREMVHPGVISYGYGEGLHKEFSWVGTLDPTPWFCAPLAIELHEAQGGAAFRAAHHRLVQEGREVIASAIDVELPHPDDPRLYGAMAAIPLPCGVDDAEALFHALRTIDKIEVPIFIWDDRVWLRISGYAAINTPDQYVRLAGALQERLRA
jgi:isopenicillin-N epimerase